MVAIREPGTILVFIICGEVVKKWCAGLPCECLRARQQLCVPDTLDFREMRQAVRATGKHRRRIRRRRPDRIIDCAAHHIARLNNLESNDANQITGDSDTE